MIKIIRIAALAAFATSMIEKFGLSRAADLLGHSSV